MTLLCRPRGRGNWKVVEIIVSWPADLFLLNKGALVTLGTTILRVVEVRP